MERPAKRAPNPRKPGGGPTSLEAIAYRLKITRIALELSQAELCRRAKIRPNAWNQYETGERRISIEAANKLCDVFGVTLDWIYRGDPSGLPYSLGKKLAA